MPAANSNDRGARVSLYLVYTYLSRYGEVAEWPKAAVC